MKIQIIAVPAGEAPPEIRKDWVGLIMPAFVREQEQVPHGFFLKVPVGVLGGRPDSENMGGYIVTTKDACDALLAAGRKAAFDWWNNNYFGEFLEFGPLFCRELN